MIRVKIRDTQSVSDEDTPQTERDGNTTVQHTVKLYGENKRTALTVTEQTMALGRLTIGAYLNCAAKCK